MNDVHTQQFDRMGIIKRQENQRFIDPLNGRTFTIIRVCIPRVLSDVPDLLVITYDDSEKRTQIYNRGDFIPVE